MAVLAPAAELIPVSALRHPISAHLRIFLQSYNPLCHMLKNKKTPSQSRGIFFTCFGFQNRVFLSGKSLLPPELKRHTSPS